MMAYVLTPLESTSVLSLCLNMTDEMDLLLACVKLQMRSIGLG